MCLFSALPPAMTWSIMGLVIFGFFIFPILDLYRKSISPLLFSVSHYITTEISQSPPQQTVPVSSTDSSIHFAFINRRKKPITMTRIGYIFQKKEPTRSKDLHNEHINWLTARPEGIIHIEAHMQKEVLCVARQHVAAPIYKLLWIFEINNTLYCQLEPQSKYIVRM